MEDKKDADKVDYQPGAPNRGRTHTETTEPLRVGDTDSFASDHVADDWRSRSLSADSAQKAAIAPEDEYVATGQTIGTATSRIEMTSQASTPTMSPLTKGGTRVIVENIGLSQSQLMVLPEEDSECMTPRG